MSWAADTLADFKAWLPATTPPASDAQLLAALELALATVETWLDRPLELAQRTQEDWPTAGVVWLRAWPVDNVASVTSNGQALELAYLVTDKRTGRIGLGGCIGGPVVTTYSGGFDPMPADVQMALWLVAAAGLPGVISAAGVDMGQAVRRVSSPDVGTVEYATAGAAGDAAGTAFLGDTLPPQVESLLARYRAESVVGGA